MIYISLIFVGFLSSLGSVCSDCFPICYLDGLCFAVLEVSIFLVLISLGGNRASPPPGCFSSVHCLLCFAEAEDLKPSYLILAPIPELLGSSSESHCLYPRLESFPYFQSSTLILKSLIHSKLLFEDQERRSGFILLNVDILFPAPLVGDFRAWAWVGHQASLAQWALYTQRAHRHTAGRSTVRSQALEDSRKGKSLKSALANLNSP